jgi:hypothetical protein
MFRMAMYHANHPNGSYEMTNRVAVGQVLVDYAVAIADVAGAAGIAILVDQPAMLRWCGCPKLGAPHATC